jgi:mannose-6-phosphate isomerase-like protein (cupin superfamily)
MGAREFIMKPLVSKSWEADYLATPPPYERQRQVIFSKRKFGISSASICSVTIPPGSKSDEHMHEATDEFWIITRGRGKVIVDGNEVAVEPEMVVCAPAKSKHQIVNSAKEVLHAYIVFGPAGPEEWLEKEIEKTSR